MFHTKKLVANACILFMEESAQREWTKSKKKLAAFTIDNLNNNVTSARSNKMTCHRLEKKYMEITVSPIVTFSNIHSQWQQHTSIPFDDTLGCHWIYLFTYSHSPFTFLQTAHTHRQQSQRTYAMPDRYKTYNFLNDQYTTKFSSKIISSIQIEMNSRAKLHRS